MNFNKDNIIICLSNDISLYWVHLLEPNKEFVLSNDKLTLYKSKRCYYIYFNGNVIDFNNYLVDLMKDNYIHLILTDFAEVDGLLQIVDGYENPNFNYSIVNHMGENIYDISPRNIRQLKNIKYYFSCSDLLNNDNQICDFQKTNKFILDYKYSLLYFYIKLGFNYIEKGPNKIVNSNRLNKIFLYSKVKDSPTRRELITMAVDTDKIYEKGFNDEDMFWLKNNYNSFHISFLNDYNICNFNLVMETQPLTKEENKLSNFCSEKTLKALMVDTPSYVVLQKDVYEQLSQDGFYFLNQEFGEYDFNNYKRFCDFLKNTDDDGLNNLFTKCYNQSKLNKLKLEDYIYSDKTKELKLLTNKD